MDTEEAIESVFINGPGGGEVQEGKSPSSLLFPPIFPSSLNLVLIEDWRRATHDSCTQS